MNAKSLMIVVLFATAATVAVGVISRQRSSGIVAAERSRHQQEMEALNARNGELMAKIALLEQERDRFKADAAEVHKLRGEVSLLRKSNEDLLKRASVAQAAATAAPVETTPPESAAPRFPASFSNHAELGQFAAVLRHKLQSGTALTLAETAWLQQMKPELEKLEGSPENFAAFQASMIQSAAGISDPEKVEKIRQTIQKVYEMAVARGLTVDAAVEDPNWVNQRHQLDRRGTTAVQKILTPEERAAFDRSFLGIMGVDLGTGVDKRLYPPGFLGEGR